MPTFNLNRKTEITSQVGVFASLVLLVLVLTFMSVKAIVLVQRKGPLITTAETPGYFDSSFKYEPHDNGFRLAFGIQGYIDKEAKDSEDYVMW